MAVAVEDGLVVPVIKDVDQKGLAAITRETKILGKKLVMENFFTMILQEVHLRLVIWGCMQSMDLHRL